MMTVALLFAIFSLASAQSTATTNSSSIAATTTTSAPLAPGKCTPMQNDAIANGTSALTACLRMLPRGAAASEACPCHNALIAAFDAAGCVPSSSSYLLSASKTHCLQSCAISACPDHKVQWVFTNPQDGASTSSSTSSTAPGATTAAGTTVSNDTPSDASTLFASMFIVAASVFCNF